MKSDRNPVPAHAQDSSGDVLPTEVKPSVPAGAAPGGLQPSLEEWPRPYAEVALPIWEHSMDLERLHTAVEARLADLSAEAGPDAPEGAYVVGITSAVAGEGKTTVALALAATVSRNSEQRVCLVDFGLTEPNLWQNLSLPMGKTGLLDVLDGRTEEPDTVRVSDHPDFVIVPAGRNTRHPAKMARSSRFASFIDLARRHFDLVIVDLPAVASNNVQPITKYVDALVMVAYSGVTPKQVTRQAISTLDPAKLLGVVLNRVQAPVTQKLWKRS